MKTSLFTPSFLHSCFKLQIYRGEKSIPFNSDWLFNVIADGIMPRLSDLIRSLSKNPGRILWKKTGFSKNSGRMAVENVNGTIDAKTI